MLTLDCTVLTQVAHAGNTVTHSTFPLITHIQRSYGLALALCFTHRVIVFFALITYFKQCY